jgi:hypothetical protein
LDEVLKAVISEGSKKGEKTGRRRRSKQNIKGFTYQPMNNLMVMQVPITVPGG